MVTAIKLVMMNRKQIDAAFKLLEKALTKTLLDTEQGTKYAAKADEFMFMNPAVEGGITWYAFKHGETRNYLYLSASGDLYVPKTAEPFKRGTFGSLNPGGV